MEKIKVLHVDDSIEYLDIFSLLIKRENVPIDLHQAISGDEAIKRVRESCLYDVALLDYQIPDMNGIELLNKIHELDSSIPIIILTAHDEEKIALDAFEHGACGCFHKDLDASGVRNIITWIIKLAEKRHIEDTQKKTDACLEILLEAQLCENFNAVMKKISEGLHNLGATRLTIFKRCGDCLKAIYSYPECNLNTSTKNKLGLNPDNLKVDVSGKEENDYTFVFQYKKAMFQTSKEQVVKNLIRSFKLHPKSSLILKKLYASEYGCTLPLIYKDDVVGLADIETKYNLRDMIDKNYFKLLISYIASTLMKNNPTNSFSDS